MKKTIILVCSAIIALLSLYSCEKNVQLEQKESTSSPTIYAYDATSKTTLGTDWKVSWDSNDALSVFNAAAGGSTYSDNCKFLIDGTPSDGKFIKDPSQTGKSLIDGESSYDWYACSPYMEYGANPGGTKGYTINRTPQQVGYNSAAHITSSDIMAGTAFGVADGTAPSIALHHVGTIMKFTVTNNTGEAAAITGLTLDATAGGSYITGSFTMNWGGSSTQPSLDATNMGSAKAYTCALSVVKNTGTAESPVYVATDETIANGASVDLYMVVAPFSIPAGGKIKLTIAGSLGSLELEKTMGSAITFAAGKYNTANLSYTKPEYVVFTETFGANSVTYANLNAGKYTKTGLTTAVASHKDNYSYSATGNTSIAVSTQTSQKINIADYGAYVEGAVAKLPATSATAANSAIYISGIIVEPNTTYIFKYNKSKGTLSGSGEYDTTTQFKWRVNGTTDWTAVNPTTAVGTISQEFTTGSETTIDIGVEATDRNPAGTITYYPALDLFKLIKK
ncbi:MAG: hypothetical protein K6A64_09720 [Bacteroidales bacterium]|nr:hypothetical protein [Bacteroidales bacterium]